MVDGVTVDRYSEAWVTKGKTRAVHFKRDCKALIDGLPLRVLVRPEDIEEVSTPYHGGWHPCTFCAPRPFR